MIQIQRKQQFEKAAERLNKEPQSIRRHEPGLYEVTNKAKGHTYHVRIERRGGHTFGTCTCEAARRTGGAGFRWSASTWPRSSCSCAPRACVSSAVATRRRRSAVRAVTGRTPRCASGT